MGGRTRRQLTRKVVQGIACSSILRKRAFFHGRPNRLRVVAGRPVSLRWAADANYSTKLRRIKNESSYKSWGRHSLHLDASGVLASNTSASAALHSSNQFSLRRLISGNKRQSGLWSLRNSSYQTSPLAYTLFAGPISFGLVFETRSATPGSYSRLRST